MNKEYLDVFQKYGFNFGRLLGSKSGYHDRNPNNLTVFNARIYTKTTYKARLEDIKDFFKGQDHEIFYGDLDLTKDLYNLYSLVILELKKSIVITTEHGRKILEINYE